MNRVEHVLTSSALYSLYCTLGMPYLTCCCEVWGNNYKTRIQSLCILQKTICLNTIITNAIQNHCFINLDHLMLLTLLTLTITAWCLCIVYKTFHNLLPTHLLSYFKNVNGSHNHNSLSFKVRIPLNPDIKLSGNVNAFKKMLKTSLLENYKFRNSGQYLILKFMLNLFFLKSMIYFMLL